ncbi:hypothetical protein WJX72_010398 [[Myrmecia] bisecta]|uniref:Peroxin-5 n=1 Tax=[Myrmecia] bisecta TaxID=41462 RepID=A0AAW1P3A0_9CHLO
MSLRELVTGSDVCTPADGGAGPSNAMGSLANALVGRSSKTQEQLRELPGVHGLPGPSAFGGPQSTVDAVARAAAEGDFLDIPGIGPSAGFADEFLAQGRSQQQAGPLPPHFAAFEDIYRQSQRVGPRGPLPGLPPGQLGMQGPQLAPFLQAFLDSGKAGAQFQPLPMPQVPLSMEDQCQIRDRSTIMARHLFADRGDAFADEQVGKLLQSLHINPQALPAGSMQAGVSWDAIFHNAAPHHLMQPTMAADVAAGGQLAATAQQDSQWANEFAQLHLREEPSASANRWANEFQQAQPPAETWAQEFEQRNGPTSRWADEFGRQTAEGTTATSNAQAVDNGAALSQTRKLADTLAANKDPKFQNSKFLQFVSKMSRGEIILEDNQAKEATPSQIGGQWATEFAASDGGLDAAWRELGVAPSAWGEEFAAQNGVGSATGWAGEFAAQKGLDPAAATWADQFAEQFAPAEEVNQWMDEFAREIEGDVAAQRQNGGMEASMPGASGEYVMSADNPFLEDVDSFAKGKELFRHGVLSEAVLALEAEVQRSPGNVDAWRLLGIVHAENDDDQQSIAAMNKALAADPTNPEVLLSLGVSYTNELDQTRALSYLHTWLANHHVHGKVAASATPLPDSSQRLSWVVGLFQQAADQAPADADIHTALGVLYNLSRNYERAADAFRTVLQLQPRDYSLWNKLGATLANSSHSGEAISAYQRALDLKPNYMRAWTNMGISQANVGKYDASARYYVRALSLNPSAANVWGYLRTSISCAGRLDLMQAVEDEDLEALTRAQPL